MAESKIDRERLKEVHQSDLTEGRLNQDLVDWLKTKGMTYLLVVMVCICGYLGWVRWRESRTSHQTEAWLDLSKAALPRAFEDVADKYPDVGSVADLARLRAAQRLLGAVQTNAAIGADVPSTDPNTPAPAPLPLSAEDRASYLERADKLFAGIAATDDQTNAKALLIVTALTGRATVAESQGNAEAAAKQFEAAAARADAVFPKLAESIRKRATGATTGSVEVALPAQASLTNEFEDMETLDPATIDPWVEKLLAPATPSTDS